MAGNATDYLGDKSVTNELAILTPYEITFRSFSPELASVLSGFANSPDGLVAKTINVEQATAAGPGEGPGAAGTPTAPA